MAAGNSGGQQQKSRTAYLGKKHDIKSYFCLASKRQSGELYGISEPITAQNWNQISESDQKKRIKNPRLFLHGCAEK